MIKFTFSDNSTITSDYITTSYTKTENCHNKLRPVDNSCSLDVLFSTALANKLKLDGDNNIKAEVRDGNNNLLFTGYLRKTFNFTKTQKNQPIKIEIVSPGFLLDKKIQTRRVFIGQTVATIVHELGLLAGQNITAATITNVVDIAVFNEGESIYDSIAQILFEHGYSFTYDKAGIFSIFQLFNVPSFPPSTILDGSDCLNAISITRNERSYDGASARWGKVEQKSDVLYRDDETQEIANNGYYKGNEDNTDGLHYLEYDSSYGEVIQAISAEVSTTTNPSSASVQKTFQNLGNRASFILKNVNGNIITLSSLVVTGSAYIKTSDNISKTSSSDRLYEFELKYIHDKATADAIVKNVAEYYRWSQYTIILQSKANVSVGNYIQVSDSGIGTYTGRIIKKTWNGRSKVYSYTVETVTDYSPATVQSENSLTSYVQSENKETVIMTSETTPSGAYVDQLGIYQGVFYKWNGTSWVRQDFVVPDNPFIHYSFDDIPDLPDGEHSLKIDNDFSSLSGWTGTASAFLKNKRLVINAASGQYLTYSLNFPGGIFVIKGRSYSNGNIILSTRQNGQSSDTVLVTQSTENEKDFEIVVPTDLVSISFKISTTNGLKCEIEKIYIGDGTYNTPLIDNSGNNYNGIFTGEIKANGVSSFSKGVVSTGTGSVLLPNFSGITDGKICITFWVKIRNENDLLKLLAIENFNSFKYSTELFVYQGQLYEQYFNSRGTSCQRKIYNIELDKWLHFALNITYTSTSISETLYINGIQATPQSSSTVQSSDYEANTNGVRLGLGGTWNTDLLWFDDFILYNRNLAEQEIIGLYMAKGNTGRLYTEQDFLNDIATNLPKDSILHYSFDDIPDLPDGTRQSVSVQNSYNCSHTESEGIVTVTPTNTSLASYYSGFYSSGMGGKIAILDVKGEYGYKYNSGFYSQDISASLDYTYTDLPDGWRRFYLIIPSNVTATFRFATVPMTFGKMYIRNIYIGDGSYTSPVIDNTNGQYNATNNGGLAVQGVSGKGIKLLNGKYLSIVNYNIPNTFTVSLWVKPENNTTGLVQNIITKAGHFILRNGTSWGTYMQLYIYTGNNTETFLNIGSLLPVEWNHIVITRNGTAVKVFRNGILAGTYTVPSDNIVTNSGNVYIGTSGDTRGQELDDIQIFDRALTELEVMRLYYNKANTPKNNTLSDLNSKKINKFIYLEFKYDTTNAEIFNKLGEYFNMNYFSIGCIGQCMNQYSTASEAINILEYNRDAVSFYLKNDSGIVLTITKQTAQINQNIQIGFINPIIS